MQIRIFVLISVIYKPVQKVWDFEKIFSHFLKWRLIETFSGLSSTAVILIWDLGKYN